MEEMKNGKDKSDFFLSGLTYCKNILRSTNPWLYLAHLQGCWSSCMDDQPIQTEALLVSVLMESRVNP